MKKEPIRVLHVLQRMEFAGVQTLLMNIYRNIDRNKVQFDFLVHYETPQYFDEEIKKMGGNIYRLSFREDYNFIKYLIDLNCFFKNHHYTIVHGHMHSLGAIYLFFAKKYNVPVRIAHSHTNCTQNDAKKILKLFMNKLYSKYANYLFACSNAAGNYMFGNRKFYVLNNAIDSKKFRFSKETRDSMRKKLHLENNIVIGCVGRFEIQKNQKFAIEVFENYLVKHPEARLIFIGTGSMESDIKLLVESKKLLDKVFFLGNRDDMASLYHAMDLFLFPSLFEGLGIVGIEAQAAGTPVLCNDLLPTELDVTPLINRLSLKSGSGAWADKIDDCISNPLAQTDMSDYINKANYDITDLSKKLEDFYLKSI